MRRKSFSLVLLILIIVSVVFLVVLLVSLINKPHKEKNDNNQMSQTVENKLDASFIESLNDIASSDEDTPQSNNQTNNEEETQTEGNVPETNTEETSSISLNDHTYKIKKTATTSIVDSVSGNQEMTYDLEDKFFVIYYGSNSEKNFQDLKASEDLVSYIESKYGVKLTSKLKTGNINNLDLIICSASDGEKQIYLMFTPLTDSEIAYAKIYNKTNENELLNDISEPLNELSSILSGKE